MKLFTQAAFGHHFLSPPARGRGLKQLEAFVEFK